MTEKLINFCWNYEPLASVLQSCVKTVQKWWTEQDKWSASWSLTLPLLTCSRMKGETQSSPMDFMSDTLQQFTHLIQLIKCYHLLL